MTNAMSANSINLQYRAICRFVCVCVCARETVAELFSRSDVKRASRVGARSEGSDRGIGSQ